MKHIFWGLLPISGDIWDALLYMIGLTTFSQFQTHVDWSIQYPIESNDNH